MNVYLLVEYSIESIHPVFIYSSRLNAFKTMKSLKYNDCVNLLNAQRTIGNLSRDYYIQCATKYRVIEMSVQDL